MFTIPFGNKKPDNVDWDYILLVSNLQAWKLLKMHRDRNIKGKLHPNFPRELIPPITAFLEEDLKLVRPGCNLTPANGVGPKRSFRTPTQKLTVVKPHCHLVTQLTSRMSPNKTPEKTYFKIFISR